MHSIVLVRKLFEKLGNTLTNFKCVCPVGCKVLYVAPPARILTTSPILTYSIAFERLAIDCFSLALRVWTPLLIERLKVECHLLVQSLVCRQPLPTTLCLISAVR